MGRFSSGTAEAEEVLSPSRIGSELSAEVSVVCALAGSQTQVSPSAMGIGSTEINCGSPVGRSPARGMSTGRTECASSSHTAASSSPDAPAASVMVVLILRFGPMEIHSFSTDVYLFLGTQPIVDCFNVRAKRENGRE